MTDSLLFDLVRYDLDSYISLNPLRDGIMIAEQLVGIDPWRTLEYQIEDLTRYLVRHDPCLYRYDIEYEERVIGVVCIRYPWLRGPYIELFGIFNGYRNMGMGSVVIDWISNRTRRQEKNLWVIASSFNKSAQRFYTSNGFYQIGSIQNLVKKNTEETLWRKELS